VSLGTENEKFLAEKKKTVSYEKFLIKVRRRCPVNFDGVACQK